MEQKNPDEVLMVHYLLGQLPEAVQLRLEERAFSDQEYLQHILAIERDLIDEYVRGELPDFERRQFERFFLASPDRLRKVKFARALNESFSESPLTERVARPVEIPASFSWWETFILWLRGASPGLKFSLAAAVLMVLFGVSWLIVANIRLRSQLSLLQAQQHPPQNEGERNQVAERQKRNEEPTEQQRTEQQHPTQVPEKMARPSPPRPAIASLMLLPGVPRSSTNLPKLIIPRGAQQAQLQIGLEKGDDYDRFRVELQTVGGKAIWRKNSIQPQAARAGRAIVVRLPVNKLDSGEYELALKGVTRQGEIEDIGYYYFSVRR